MLETINPTTGQALPPSPSLSLEQAHAIIDKVANGFTEWKAKSFAKRTAVLKAVAASLRDNQNELANLMALEMGKPIKEGLAEVEKSAWCADYYAEHGADFLASESLESDASHSYVQYPPLGTVLGILPWNAPVWLALRFLAPALMAGNTCVLKADPNVPATANKLVECLYQAGVPENAVANLAVPNSVASKMIDHPKVKAVSFTGSSKAGQFIASQAAAGLKPAVLELGGSDPCILMADADLEKALDIITLSRMINAGQSCIAVKRLFVEKSIYNEVCEALRQRFSKLKCGDPRDENNNLGPLAREDLRDQLHRQVSQSIDAGARCLTGGDLPSRSGFFYPPTLLVDVKPGMTVFEEETFGPVLSVTPIETIDQALELANDTEYGLGASIWTSNQATIDRAIKTLESGQIAVNGIVKSDPRLPSGGIGKSGYGRELGPQGIREFVNVQQIWIA
ncbi:NAD-dependent succinate-semialdehyde dehydrogenase [Marinomonas hwangdonensis]|uniref:NAD-dependent succinate-semialdehyde dehydrogenase n=1 Tax=Marinomonas hwangdonensis TaxID=1053647 RepID=A0A3M8Q9Z7_9GAMM|nr:NAD-dependent succinate-semialdehyde dehydrogenase [Marinomonas hwangdonensis]RNF52869.1 NAD-dependent succinate-semialdehyde dehydrogenase [Marinomonas hwangdonensis]